MKRLFGAFILFFSLTLLYAGEWEPGLVVPDKVYGPDRYETVLLPFPVKLEENLLTLKYQSSLSCHLILKSDEGREEIRLLPPRKEEGEYTLEALPVQSVSSLSLRTADGDPVLFSLKLTPSGDFESPAPKADHDTILSAEPSGRGEQDFDLYTWNEGNNILLFDFADYAVQDLYLKRLAFFTEKPGFRGTLMTDEEMEGLHGWNAHDYSASSLASFFNLSLKEDFPLNEEEKQLGRILLDRGILILDRDGYFPVEGALVSLARESNPALRRRFITHESLHGLFFTDEEFKGEIQACWESLPVLYRKVWRLFMAYNDYDPTDEVLMYNEMMGYVLQLSRAEVRSYYTWRFNRIMELHPETIETLGPLMEGIPEVMEDIYYRLEKITAPRYSYNDGRFSG